MSQRRNGGEPQPKDGMPPAKGEGMLTQNSIVAWVQGKADGNNSAGQTGEALVAGSWTFLSREGPASG